MSKFAASVKLAPFDADLAYTQRHLDVAIPCRQGENTRNIFAKSSK